MKARLIEQYDVTLTKPEMRELMTALRVFVRDYEASPAAEELLAGLDEVFQGGKAGIGVDLRAITSGLAEDAEDDDEDGGSAVPAP